MLSPDHLELIANAAAEASAMYEVRARLEAVDDPDGALRPAVLAFGFNFLTAQRTEDRDRRGGAWGPLVQADGQQFPPPLETVGNEVLDAWQQMLESIDEPPVHARCGDLLWVRKHGPRPAQAARLAVRGYLDLAQNDNWSVMERTDGCARALELALDLRDSELVSRVPAEMSAAADREIASSELRPGVTLRLLQPLVNLPTGLRPTGVREQLAAADDRYGSDPYISQSVWELLGQLSKADERREIERGIVHRWIAEAEKGDALMRVFRLQQALERALSAGLRGEVSQIRVLMAQVTADELDLKRVATEVALPQDEIDAFSGSLSTLELPVALRLFGAQGPPTGDPTDPERAAAAMLREHPLLGSMSRVILGETYPAVVFKADTPERRERLEVSQHRARAARTWGVAALSILDALFATDTPNKADLESALATPWLSPDLQERIARAFELHLLRQYDECVHLLVPRLEAAVRELAAAAGVPVVVPPRGEEPGGVASLESVLSALKGLLDEGWRVYLKTVLTDRLALNLRSAVAHGTRTSFGPVDAALLLHVACFLIGLTAA